MEKLRTRKQIAEVFTRHRDNCPDRNKGGDYHRCSCPKHIYVNDRGQVRRFSAETESWAKAEKQAQEIRDAWDPNHAELLRLRAEKEITRLTVAEAAKLYIDDLQTRNMAALTVANAKSLFQSTLAHWIEKENIGRPEEHRLVYLDQLDGAVLAKWRGEWKAAPLTKRNRWSRVRSFFNWFVGTGRLKLNPCIGVRQFSAEEGTTTPLIADQFERLLSAIDKVTVPKNVASKTREAWKPRLRALILLQRWTGLAISDALSLKRSEMVYDSETGHWCVDTDRQKTGVPVFVPLPDDVAHELRQVPPEHGTHAEYFFLNPANDINSETARWQRRLRDLFTVADLRDEFGKPIRMHSHKLRNTFAALALSVGVPLEHVSKALGHDSIKTTEKSYAKWIKARQILVVNSLASSWEKQRNLVSIAKGRKAKGAS